MNPGRKTDRTAHRPRSADPVGELLPAIRGIEPLLNPKEDRATANPADWIANTLGEHLWSKQRIIAKSVQRKRFTAVRSCHGIGKSYLASRLANWWIATKPDPFVVTTAPSGHQVRSILWREIKRGKAKGKLRGRITEGQVPEWKIGDQLVAFGRKPADYVDPAEAATAFQGIHALNLLVILDEASGIPEWLATAVETLVTNTRSRVLAIGNPDNPTSWFAKINRPGSGYNVIKVNARMTPNFTGEPIPELLKDLLVSKIWVAERLKRWGKNNPLYIAKVDAEFPLVTDDTVFTPYHIQIAAAVDRSRHALSKESTNYGGLDVARMGSDECCLYINANGHVRHYKSWGKTETMETVGIVRRELEGRPWPHLNIDANGVGAGVYDRLRELGHSVIPFMGGERAFNPQKYRNRRTEAYWEAREAMEQGLIDVDINDDILIAELLEVKYKLNSLGQILLEEKDDTHRRLGRSPNRADAFVMALQRRADWIKVLNPQFNSNLPQNGHISQTESGIFVALGPQTIDTDGEIFNSDLSDLNGVKF
jgi:hypothetical protein